MAYGSDTEKARQILLDIAAQHPGVLEDPAPIATFDQFADSSQNLVFRAYLPDLDNRLGTTSDLHTEISKRFADAGIEISFPQLDVHVQDNKDGTLFTANGVPDRQEIDSAESSRSVAK